MDASEAKVISFVSAGHPSPADEFQIQVISDFFDVFARAIELGSEKLGLVQSKIENGEFWLKNGDGGYYIINPDPEVQTIIRSDDNGNRDNGNFGLYTDWLQEVAQGIQQRIDKAAQ